MPLSEIVVFVCKDTQPMNEQLGPHDHQKSSYLQTFFGKKLRSKFMEKKLPFFLFNDSPS